MVSTGVPFVRSWDTLLPPPNREAPLKTAPLLLFALVATAEAGPTDPTELTRRQAAHLAVERNLDLLVAKAGPELASLKVSVSWRPFVPVLTLESGARRAGRDDAADTSADYKASLRWSLPSGTVLSANANGADPLAGAPTPAGAIDVSLTQSMLRGSPDGAGHPLREAELDLRVEKVRFEKAVEDLLLEVERAYWGLALAQANVETKRRSVQRAKRQYDITAENIRRGLKPPGDIYFVEDSLVSFREQLLRNEEGLSLAQRALARLLDLPPEGALRAVEALEGQGAPLPAGLSPGNNPEHRLVQLEGERRALKRRFEEDQASSRLDLKATLAVRGGAETPWDDVLGGDTPDGRVGVVFEVPLAGGPDQARAQRAALEETRQAGRIAASGQRLRVSAGDLRVRLEGQAKRLDLTKRQVELAKKALDNAKDQFENGVSPLNEVVRFQQRLDGAMVAAQKAIVDLRIRRAELLKAQGALRDDLEVRIK